MIRSIIWQMYFWSGSRKEMANFRKSYQNHYVNVYRAWCITSSRLATKQETTIRHATIGIIFSLHGQWKIQPVWRYLTGINAYYRAQGIVNKRQLCLFPAAFRLQFVVMDILGSLPKTESGYQPVLLFSDHCTKFTSSTLVPTVTLTNFMT